MVTTSREARDVAVGDRSTWTGVPISTEELSGPYPSPDLTRAIEVSTIAPATVTRVVWAGASVSQPAEPAELPSQWATGDATPGMKAPSAAMGGSETPEPGTWIRLEHHDPATNNHKVLGRWHRVRGWDAERSQVILLCTARDRNLSWALSDGVRFMVARSLLRSPDGGECQHCLRRADEILFDGGPAEG